MTQQPVRPWEAALAALWQKQSRWSRKADELKETQHAWTGPLVVATLIGVTIGTLTPLVAQWTKDHKGPGWVPTACGLVGTALVSIAAYLSKTLLGPKEAQDWVAARAVAEALKAEGYIYAAGAPPYEDPETAPKKLLERMDELSRTDRELGILPDAAPDVAKKHPHRPLAVDEYVEVRVIGQTKYNDDHARDNARQLARWRRTAIVLGLVSVLIGLGGTLLKNETVTALMAVVTTAIATLTAYVYGSRFEFQASSCFATAERLRDLKTRWQVTTAPDASEGHRFVLDCEAAIAAQNRAWAGELSRRAQEKLLEKK